MERDGFVFTDMKQCGRCARCDSATGAVRAGSWVRGCPGLSRVNRCEQASAGAQARSVVHRRDRGCTHLSTHCPGHLCTATHLSTRPPNARTHPVSNPIVCLTEEPLRTFMCLVRGGVSAFRVYRRPTEARQKPKVSCAACALREDRDARARFCPCVFDLQGTSQTTCTSRYQCSPAIAQCRRDSPDVRILAAVG